MTMVRLHHAYGELLWLALLVLALCYQASKAFAVWAERVYRRGVNDALHHSLYPRTYTDVLLGANRRMETRWGAANE